MTRIHITWDKGEVYAQLRDTPTTRELIAALPIESHAHTWGDEVYFATPVKAEKEDDAQQVVDPGTVCFWVEGQSLALPFGPTPISHGDECRLAARVNILGTVEGDAKVLGSIEAGDTVKVCLAEEVV
jgi:hypothetical protein